MEIRTHREENTREVSSVFLRTKRNAYQIIEQEGGKILILKEHSKNGALTIVPNSSNSIIIC